MTTYFGLQITDNKTINFGIQYMTSYGLKYMIKPDINGITKHFDLMQAKMHMRNFNCVILDEFNNPIDNEFDLNEIITQQKEFITKKVLK